MDNNKYIMNYNNEYRKNTINLKYHSLAENFSAHIRSQIYQSSCCSPNVEEKNRCVANETKQNLIRYLN